MLKAPNYVTNSDLKAALSAFEKRLDKKFEEYRDDVLTKFDSIMKELEAMREDSTLGVYQTREVKEEVDDHEKRITKLESA